MRVGYLAFSAARAEAATDDGAHNVHQPREAPLQQRYGHAVTCTRGQLTHQQRATPTLLSEMWWQKAVAMGRYLPSLGSA